jgi:RHS repeat-associated protein
LLETRRAGDENAEPEGLERGGLYIWSLRYIDSPILLEWYNPATPRQAYYTTDANHNVTALVLCSTVYTRYVYDPYGKVTFYDATWSNTQTPISLFDKFLFCGYYHDNETGLYHVRNRYYEPYFGWITRDPAGYADWMSLYEYVSSGPIGLTDPMGLRPMGPQDPGYQPGYETLPWKDVPGTEKKCPEGGGGGGGGVGGGGNGGWVPPREEPPIGPWEPPTERVSRSGDGVYDWYFGLEEYKDYGNTRAKEKYRDVSNEEATLAQSFSDSCRAFRQWQMQPEIDDLKLAQQILGHSTPDIEARLQQIQMEIDAAGAYGESAIRKSNETALVAIGTMTVAAGGAVAVEMGAVPATISAASTAKAATISAVSTAKAAFFKASVTAYLLSQRVPYIGEFIKGFLPGEPALPETKTEAVGQITSQFAEPAVMGALDAIQRQKAQKSLKENP